MHALVKTSEDSLEVSQRSFVLACVGHGREWVLWTWLLVVGCVERMTREGVVVVEGGSSVRRVAIMDGSHGSFVWWLLK